MIYHASHMNFRNMQALNEVRFRPLTTVEEFLDASKRNRSSVSHSATILTAERAAQYQSVN